MSGAFPSAAYFVAASRLRPGLDGGYTVATLQRAEHLAAAGARPTLLTFDPAPVDGVLDAFAELGLASAETRMRNLFADLRARPELVRAAALAPFSGAEPGERDTLVLDDAGSPLLRLPFVPAVDWHRSTAEIPVLAPDGAALGALAGFGALYRLWVDAVVAEEKARLGVADAVVIVEARQVGELLGPAPRDYALVHTVHNAHTEPPYAWDSPMDTLWSGWFEAIDSFDAVLWLTEQQRSDAARRVGERPGWGVVPHPATPPATFPDPGGRDPLLAIMIARLSDQKQVEHAVRAWPAVRERVPGARLEVLGDGPHRAELEALVAELGLAGAVVLRGYVPRAADELGRAGLLVLSSRYEGQPLSILEALSAATPVVAYDVRYGPAEMVEPGVSGALVPPGDVAALAEAVAGILGRPERIAELSRGAWEWARAHGVDRSMRLTAELVTAALARRSADPTRANPATTR